VSLCVCMQAYGQMHAGRHAYEYMHNTADV
jgi:hypothetical protein